MLFGSPSRNSECTLGASWEQYFLEGTALVTGTSLQVLSGLFSAIFIASAAGNAWWSLLNTASRPRGLPGSDSHKRKDTSSYTTLSS